MFVDKPTHFTENSGSLKDIILVNTGSIVEIFLKALSHYNVLL